MNLLLASAALGNWVDTTFAGFDMAIFQFFASIRCAIGNLVAMIFTAFGDEVYMVLFAIFGLVLIFFKRSRKWGFAIVFAVIIGTLVTNVIMKPMFLRVRPYNTLQATGFFNEWYAAVGQLCESDFTFPSGHTTAATEVGVVLCMLFASAKKKKIAWIFPVIAFLVGCSRIYLMVHYPTDVLASFVIGAAAGVIGYYLAKLCCLIFKKTGIDDKLDLEKRHIRKKGRRISRAGAGLAISAAMLFIYMVSFVKLEVEVHSDLPRCEYSEEYDCMNEAKTGSKYPAIDGKDYCKIHRKEFGN